ncbi:type II secretion system F family protein [Streptomyces sp. KK5PA1]|uniref:Type II secretion system F family protein n=1 Tax=Actinacidiphila acididurans TaxID=2784346 RepID=A0ABS2TQZ8_9ACTN|nr:type II secretion system F family protein [Actinacidiphila acididurans]
MGAAQAGGEASEYGRSTPSPDRAAFERGGSEVTGAERAERGRGRRVLRQWGPAIGAGTGVAVLVGGLAGLLGGVVAGIGLRMWLGRREQATPEQVESGGPDPAELPLCADLMAACLAAGATPGEAAGAVGRCLGGPLGAALIRARAELRLGADPGECWERLGRVPGAHEMGRCLARASTTGTAPVAEMARLAADYRAAQARSALGRARKAAVLATAPLGVCFLPAFLLVGVAPVVMGLAGTVLGGRAG